MTSYEAVLNQINVVPAGKIGDDRAITWLTDAKVVGIARNSRGHLELFLTGDELKPRTGAVKTAMRYHSWHRDSLPPLDANRICLPALGHFDQVGAFIAAELLREKAEVDLERAFFVTEPLIELAINRLEVSENAILGLVGELLLLDALCRRADDRQVGPIVQAWDGWRRSARDFTWEGTGVEIKTTTRATSSHAIHGIHQPEIDAPVWRPVPAGPRQGIDSGFPSPSHPRRKAGRMPRVGCGFQPKEGRKWVT